MKKTITTISIIILAVSIIPLANASTTENIFAGRGDIATLNIYLQTQQTIKGSFNVSGGREHIIDFWVRDPKGAIILDSGTVSEQINFEFTANSEGEYVFNFENNDSGYSRSISLEYDIESEFLPLPNQENLLLWIIIIALVIGLAIMGSVIAFLLRRKNK